MLFGIYFVRAPRLALLVKYRRRFCFVHGILSTVGARLALVNSKVGSCHGGIQVPVCRTNCV